jgi:hypothetical protein
MMSLFSRSSRTSSFSVNQGDDDGMAALDALLRRREFVEPSEFAIQDILQAARSTPRAEEARPLHSPAFSVRDVLARYLEPAPAFTFACLLLVGLWAGSQHASLITQQETYASEAVATSTSLSSSADEEGIL